MNSAWRRLMVCVVGLIKSTGKIPTYEELAGYLDISRTHVASLVWDMCDNDLLPADYKNFDWCGNCLSKFLLEEPQNVESILAARLLYHDAPRGEYLNQTEYSILEAITIHFLKHSTVPTYPELVDMTGAKSRGHLHKVIASMNKKGFLKTHRYKKGGLTILHCPWAMRPAHLRAVREMSGDESETNEF